MKIINATVLQVLKVLPICLMPFVLDGDVTDTNLNADNEAALGLLEKEIENVTPLSIKELQEKEKKAIEDAEIFLKTYTGNGNYNFGSINRFIEGLKLDYETVHEEAKTLKGIDKLVAMAYPKNYIFLPGSAKLVAKEIEKRARKSLTFFLGEEMGVDPKTGEVEDNSEINVYVKKPILEEFARKAHIIKNMVNRTLPPGKEMLFKEGISMKILNSLKEGKIPKEIEIVDKKARIKK